MCHFVLKKKDRLLDQLKEGLPMFAYLHELFLIAQSEHDVESVEFLRLCFRSVEVAEHGATLKFEDWAEEALKDDRVKREDKLYRMKQERFHNRFRELFHEKGWTVRELATEATVSPTTVQNALRGDNPLMPHPATIEKLAAALRTSLEDLTGGNTPQTANQVFDAMRVRKHPRKPLARKVS